MISNGAKSNRVVAATINPSNAPDRRSDILRSSREKGNARFRLARATVQTMPWSISTVEEQQLVAVSSETITAPRQKLALRIGKETESSRAWQWVTEGKISQLEATLGSGEAVEAMHRFNWLLRESDEEGTLESGLSNVRKEWSYRSETFSQLTSLVQCKVWLRNGAAGKNDRNCESMRLSNAAWSTHVFPEQIINGVSLTNNVNFNHYHLYTQASKLLIGDLGTDFSVDGPDAQPNLSRVVFKSMYEDLMTASHSWGSLVEPRDKGLQERSYALGHQLASECLGLQESKLLLDSFLELEQSRCCSGDAVQSCIETLSRGLKAQRAAACCREDMQGLVPESHAPILRRAMKDYEREVFIWYNGLADILEYGKSSNVWL